MNDIEQKAQHIARLSVESILCLDHLPPLEKKLSQLGADSLDRIEIGMDAEDRAGIALTDDEVENVVTVGDLATIIGGKMAASLTGA